METLLDYINTKTTIVCTNNFEVALFVEMCTKSNIKLVQKEIVNDNDTNFYYDISSGSAVPISYSQSIKHLNKFIQFCDLTEVTWKKVVRENGLYEWVDSEGVGHPDEKSAFIVAIIKAEVKYNESSNTKTFVEILKEQYNSMLLHGCNGNCRRQDFPGKYSDIRELMKN